MKRLCLLTPLLLAACSGAPIPSISDAGADSIPASDFVSGQMSVAGSVTVPTYDGGVSNVDPIIYNAINTSLVPYDPDAIYFLLSSSEVNLNTWCSDNCAWHSSFTAPFGTDVKLVRYAVTGNVQVKCPNKCDYTVFSKSPQPQPNNVVADPMIYQIAHELAESATNPDSFSWFSTDGEIADLCAWVFGDVYTRASDGAWYNIQISNRQYMIQKIWALNSNVADHCTLGINPGFDPSMAGMPIHFGYGEPKNVAPVGYVGGRVLNKPIRVYWLWMGEWKERSVVEPILTTFVSDLGGSEWWSIVREYWQSPVSF